MRLGLVALALASASAFIACGSGIAFAPDTITINGRVVSGGLAVPSAPFWAADRAQPVRAAALGDATASFLMLTDASGHFYIYGFGATYDLTIARPNDRNDLTVIRGLTRRNPVIDLPLRGSLPLHSAHLDVAWSVAPAAGTKVAYFLDGALRGDVRFDSLEQVDDDPAHGLTATWHGGGSTAANLNALVYTVDASGKPTGYVAAAYAYVVLVSGRPLAIGLQTTSMNSSPATVSTTTASAEWVVDSLTVAVDHGNCSTAYPFFEVEPASLPATISLPDLNGNRVVGRGDAHRGGETSHGVTTGVAFPDQTLPLVIDFPAPATLSAPSDLATVDPATPFTFAGDGVNEVLFTPAGKGPRVRIVTTEKTVTLGMLPDTSIFVPGA
ncbi:MAG: hypothetical protein ABI551_04210, partial [Polyangiaceae bacterium]